MFYTDSCADLDVLRVQIYVFKVQEFETYIFKRFFGVLSGEFLGLLTFTQLLNPHYHSLPFLNSTSPSPTVRFFDFLNRTFFRWV
ncbi:hypothetical protein AGABI1DRAFT_134796 [Agaricus bisporus var. burnettii JB137-S8]|uniref:Uncharacterized protein n=1 Tax=Agaricus bisporus var. burnettii (strain JB137-S8 / ATCC MYA-4627 / FGSC 10392) TaxID=597362 RepID=K5XGA1_AGABU|nr:uncharacterized protein AGABI1DRAFT_134796 [Agaricus bisporus var. burnettii JB137-S8]EKM73425.1 hypothetical protein AGABI1DRAFT_134796 [Agaricus bisporus var. burnettii JB137-S8]